MKTNLIVTLTALTLAGAATYALASKDDAREQSERDQWLPKQQVEAQLNQMGYEVQRLKADDGCIEADVIDRDGVRSELYVDPMTGNPGCGEKIQDRDDS